MNQATLPKEYIPDTSEAERWLSEDVFLYKGMKFKVMPDYQVVPVNSNGSGKKG